MNKVYTYAIKLQDMFSPQMQRVANMYQQKISVMDRLTSRLSGMMGKATTTVERLFGKLKGLGTSAFKLRMNSSDIDSADRKATSLLNKIKSFAGRSAFMGGAIGGGIGGLVSGAVDGIMNQIGLLKDKTLGAAQSNESTMFSLNELMGKGAAAKLVQDIDRYAPENRDGLINSSRMLAGAGVENSKLMATITALNNISALTGDNVSELANIQAQIKSTGYVQGDEINMFKQRGINLNPYLANVMGAKEGDISKLQSKGLITYDIFDKAMQKYAGKGGRFDGVYERKRDTTTEGKEKSTTGRTDALLLAYGNKMLPIKNAILTIFETILKWEGPVVGVFQKIWGAVSPLAVGFGGLLQRLGILNDQFKISDGVMSTVTFLWEYLGHVFDLVTISVTGVSNVIGWLVDSPLAMLIVGVYGASKAWALLNIVMAANPFSLIVIGIAAVAAGVMYAWDKFDGFRESVLSGWEKIKVVFSNIGGFLLKLMTGDITGALAIVGKTMSEGSANAHAAVLANRAERKNAKADGGLLAGVNSPLGGATGTVTGTGTGTGGLGAAAGLNSTVGNAKSNSITINIKSLIEKSEIHVADLQDGIGDIESKLIDAMLRLANSGTRVAS